VTAPRSRSGDGHAVRNGVARSQTPPDERPIGAFDLLAAQIELLRQEIDYLKEQVALLQEENNLRNRERDHKR
jgi:hypothetical protein